MRGLDPLRRQHPSQVRMASRPHPFPVESHQSHRFITLLSVAFSPLSDHHTLRAPTHSPLYQLGSFPPLCAKEAGAAPLRLETPLVVKSLSVESFSAPPTAPRATQEPPKSRHFSVLLSQNSPLPRGLALHPPCTIQCCPSPRTGNSRRQ